MNSGKEQGMLAIQELHLRREIERMADKVKVGLSYIKGGYTLHYTGWNNIALFPTSVGMMGPYTLQQCHDKLREISGEE